MAKKDYENFAWIKNLGKYLHLGKCKCKVNKFNILKELPRWRSRYQKGGGSRRWDCKYEVSRIWISLYLHCYLNSSHFSQSSKLLKFVFTEKWLFKFFNICIISCLNGYSLNNLAPNPFAFCLHEKIALGGNNETKLLILLNKKVPALP